MKNLDDVLKKSLTPAESEEEGSQNNEKKNI